LYVPGGWARRRRSRSSCRPGRAGQGRNAAGGVVCGGSARHACRHASVGADADGAGARDGAQGGDGARGGIHGTRGAVAANKAGGRRMAPGCQCQWCGTRTQRGTAGRRRVRRPPRQGCASPRRTAAPRGRRGSSAPSCTLPPPGRPGCPVALVAGGAGAAVGRRWPPGAARYVPLGHGAGSRVPAGQ